MKAYRVHLCNLEEPDCFWQFPSDDWWITTRGGAILVVASSLEQVAALLGEDVGVRSIEVLGEARVLEAPDA